MNWFRIYSDGEMAFQHKNHISKRFNPFPNSIDFYKWICLAYDCLPCLEIDKRIWKFFKRIPEDKAVKDYKNFKLGIQ